MQKYRNEEDWTLQEKIKWCIDSTIIGHCDAKCLKFMEDIETAFQEMPEEVVLNMVPEIHYIGEQRKSFPRKNPMKGREEIFREAMRSPFMNSIEKKKIQRSYEEETDRINAFFVDGKKFWREKTQYNNEKYEAMKPWVDKVNRKCDILKSSVKSKTVIDYKAKIHKVQPKEKVSSKSEEVEKQSEIFEE
jgi:hypothetical protein